MSGVQLVGGLTVLATAATLASGARAVRAGRRLHLLMAFGAGVLLGAAIFDLLPKALAAGARGGGGRAALAVTGRSRWCLHSDRRARAALAMHDQRTVARQLAQAGREAPASSNWAVSAMRRRAPVGLAVHLIAHPERPKSRVGP